MREQSVQRYLIAKLNRLGTFYNTQGGAYTERGVPDILGCLNGEFWAIEVKAERGRTTALQRYQLQRIKEAGGHTRVVRGMVEARELIQGLRKGKVS